MSMEPKDQIFARMYVVITLVSLLPILVAFQVLNISVLKGPDLREQVETQSTAFLTIPASRGLILDSKGRPFAVNIETYEVAVDPSVKGFDAQADAFYEVLSRVSGQSAAALKRKVERRSSTQYALLATNLTLSKSDVTEIDGFPFSIIQGHTRRQYPHGQTASHVVGFVGRDGGLTGLENRFDAELTGVSGKKTAKKNARGQLKPIPGGLVQDPEHGHSLVLTIDLNQQAILEEELEKGVLEARAEWGTAIAVDVNTGAILAMANYPTFDLNQGNTASFTQTRNHAIADMIEPGSTMKMLPAVAAIESGTVTMDTIIDTGEGFMRKYGFDLRDTHPHGKISFTEVIKVSSNIGTHLVAEISDKGEFYKYARNLGFNQPTFIELPGEATATVVKKTDDWSVSTHSAMSRGYELMATPIQIAMAYASLANGGLLMKPYIVKEKRDINGNVIWKAQVDSVRRAFDATTAQKLVPAFESVVGKGGTAEQAMVPGLRIAGKTGTAKTAEGKGYASSHYRATFVGLYPVEKPQVVILVLMDAPRFSIYGGVVAAPVFRRTTERWLASMPEVAKYVNMDSVAVARARKNPPRRKANAVVALDQSESYPMIQMTAPEIPVVTASLADSVAVMPNMIGMSARRVSEMAAKMGVKVKITGHGVVKTQWPEPGEALSETMVLSMN